MKLIGLLLISFAAYATAGEKYEITAVLTKVEPKPSKMFFIRGLNGEKMGQAEIKDESRRGNKWLQSYYEKLLINWKIIGSGTDKSFGSGSDEYLCSDQKPEVVAVVELMEKILAVNLKCPLEPQKGEQMPDDTVTGTIVLDEDPGDSELVLDIQLVENKKTFLTVKLTGKVAKS